MTNPSFEDTYRSYPFWPLVDIAMKVAEGLAAWRQRGAELPSRAEEVRLAS